MHRFISAFLPFLLAACVSLPPPLSPESAARLRTQKTVVAYFDQWESIRYMQKTYLVLGEATTASSSTYSGIWDANKELSALHASGFSRIGVPADSLYEVLTPTELADSLIEQKALASDYRNRLERESPLPQHFRDILLARGYKNLVWITHDLPFSITIQPILVPEEIRNSLFFFLSYYIYDLPANRIMFVGRTHFFSKFPVEGDSVKYFLEKDNLAVLKAMTTKHISDRYNVSKQMASPQGGLTVGQFLGLEERPAP